MLATSFADMAAMPAKMAKMFKPVGGGAEVGGVGRIVYQCHVLGLGFRVKSLGSSL
jgi:hypothetical protein